MWGDYIRTPPRGTNFFLIIIHVLKLNKRELINSSKKLQQEILKNI